MFVSRSRITIGTATSSTASSSFSRCWLTLSATNSTSTLTSSRTRTYYHKKFSTCTTTAASHGFIGGGGGDDAAISSAAFARGLKQEEETHDIAAKPFQSPDNSHFFHNGKPTLAYARTLPKTFATMTNDQVIHFGELGVPEACRECIVRDIMMVDGISVLPNVTICILKFFETERLTKDAAEILVFLSGLKEIKLDSSQVLYPIFAKKRKSAVNAMPMKTGARSESQFFFVG